KREFITHTGWLGKKRITVMSTGIGTDNIDIVLNELDALVNIDLASRTIKPNLTSLQIMRIGTSGSLHPDVDIDSIVISGRGVGMDALGFYYTCDKVNHPLLPDWAYWTKRYDFSLKHFPAPFTEGITMSFPGFYGPQGRTLRIEPKLKIPIDELHKHTIDGLPFTNLEMETAAIYLLAEKLGHQAISFNAILANRIIGRFSKDTSVPVDKLIMAVLEWISNSR
ncbi:MAG TPA: hypothetical protein VJ508_04240, partial [Saprospiraceae bacterium]|nr:hypothetical protein [Saprospiraceae bacterium]